MRAGAASGPSSLSAADASRLKRNPSFTTRKRTSSLRKVKRMDNPEDLAPVEMGGFLDRKHEQQSGGKRAAIRSWKTYYTGIYSFFFLLIVKMRRKSNWYFLFSFSIVWSVALFLQGTR